jgi:hypothetical protein
MLCLLMRAASFAEDAPPATDDAKEKLCQETIEKCKETESTQPTPEMLMAKVGEACKLVEAEGEASFPKFKGKDSAFLFAGTYIWIHSADTGKTLMHPIKYKMEGMPLLNLKDANGKLFFAEMTDVAKKSGSGWVEYVWPKPGEKEPAPKVSYVKLAKHDGKAYVVGCGVYDMTMKDVEAAMAKK